MTGRAEAEAMPRTRTTLSGRTGWTAVAGLSTVLTLLVAGQLPAASAQGRALAPASSELASSSAADVLPGAFRRTTLPAPPVAPVAEPGVRSPVQPAVQPAVQSAAQPAAAPVAAADTCSGDGWQQRRGSAALASLRPGAAARTGFRIEFQAARAGYMGLTHLKQRRIEMFVRACGTQSDELLRHVMAHELGHAYDTARNDADRRAAWKAARGIPAATPWYGCSGCTDFATPAGDFAEVYAQWARGASTNRSRLAGDVPPGQLTALAKRFFGA